MFSDILNKTKSLLTESEEIEDQDAPEGEWDEETNKAAEATKHVEGSVSKEKNFPNTPSAKQGQFDDVKKKAAEATKHVEGSVSNEKNFPNTPSVKTGEWDKNVKGQAAEAKKHIHMNESWMYEDEMNEYTQAQIDAFDKNGNKIPFEKEDMEMLHKSKNIKEMESDTNLKGPLSIFAQYLNKDVFQRVIDKIDNNKQTFEAAFEVMLKEMLEQNPDLATSSLKNNLKNIVIKVLDTVIQTNTNPQADLANQAMQSTNESEEDMQMDRFDEVFDGLNEEDLYEDNDTQSIESGAEKVADKIEDVLSTDELNFLKQAYVKGGKEMIANALSKSINEGLPEPPAEGEFGMSQNEIKLRQILDKLIMRGALGSLAGIIPAAMMGHPSLAIGLGIAALTGSFFKDAAWWKKNSHHYGAQNKYGVK
jgi:hypothetical protein